MRATRMLGFGFGTALLIALPAAADQARDAEQPGALLRTERSRPRPAGRADPYRSLFQVPDLGTPAPRPRAAPPRPRPELPRRQEPAIVCGMTIFPIDPAIDPGIYVPPGRRDTRHAIRAIPPPICR